MNCGKQNIYISGGCEIVKVTNVQKLLAKLKQGDLSLADATSIVSHSSVRRLKAQGAVDIYEVGEGSKKRKRVTLGSGDYKPRCLVDDGARIAAAIKFLTLRGYEVTAKWPSKTIYQCGIVNNCND